MKTRAGILTSVSLCAVVLPGSALYAQQSNGQGKLYLEFEAGVALQQNVDVEVPQTVELEFDPGVRFDIGAGYRFSDSLAVEVQVGYVFNSIDLIGGVDPSDVGVDLDLQQIPITANLIYTFPLESRFKPFVGGGAGGSVAVAVGESSGETDT